jgi:hypothetical protein
LLISDLNIIVDWSKAPPISTRYAHTYYSNPIGEFVIDHAFYRKTMKFYETRGVWTWSQEPREKCKLYLL